MVSLLGLVVHGNHAMFPDEDHNFLVSVFCVSTKSPKLLDYTAVLMVEIFNSTQIPVLNICFTARALASEALGALGVGTWLKEIGQDRPTCKGMLCLAASGQSLLPGMGTSPTTFPMAVSFLLL